MCVVQSRPKYPTLQCKRMRKSRLTQVPPGKHDLDLADHTNPTRTAISAPKCLDHDIMIMKRGSDYLICSMCGKVVSRVTPSSLKVNATTKGYIINS